MKHTLGLLGSILVALLLLSVDIDTASAAQTDTKRETSATTARAAATLPADVELFTSSDRPTVGELWTVFGRITNRSDKPIWLVNTKTVLNVPPEVWGTSSLAGSIVAFFPSSTSDPNNDGSIPTIIVKVEPGGSYLVSWRIDSWEVKNQMSKLSGWTQVANRIHTTIQDFLFFRPANYAFSAIVFIWPTTPNDEDQAYKLTSTKEIYIDNSPWILILGALIGGLIACFLQITYSMSRDTLRSIGGMRYIFLGPLIAILLCTVATVLISRVGTNDFIFSIHVRDVWGSLASGFLIQWLGMNYFTAKLAKLGLVESSAARQRRRTSEERIKGEKIELEHAPNATATLRKANHSLGGTPMGIIGFFLLFLGFILQGLGTYKDTIAK